MSRCGVLFVRAAKANVRAHGNQRRAVSFLAGVLQCERHSFDVVAPFDSLHVPAESGEPRQTIFGKRQLCAAFNRNVVVCVKNYEFSKMLVACDRSSHR